MFLAIDAGNTNIVFAVSRVGEQPMAVWRCRTDAARTCDEYASWLYPLFQQAHLNIDDVKAVMIASVVPGANFHLRRYCETYLRCTPQFVGDSGVETGLVVAMPKPEEVGADRIVNAVAARTLYPLPAIVIDFGTATTFDVVNADGAYIGGIIAPGINLSLEALQRAAAKLPKIDLVKPDKVIGNDTVSAMRAGVFWGYVGMMEGLLTRVVAELGVQAHVVATGGLAPLFADSMPAIHTVEPDLTLRGLDLIYTYNLKKKVTAA